jgi:hypothetical protein
MEVISPRFQLVTRRVGRVPQPPSDRSRVRERSRALGLLSAQVVRGVPAPDLAEPTVEAWSRSRTVALIVLPFAVGFSSHTTALVFYLVVGVGGLAATLATRFEPAIPAEHSMMARQAA